MDNMHLPEGKTLGNGRYRIVRFIGAGGFGCTYEAEFVEMRTRVAIKEFFVGSYCNRDATGMISVGTSSQKALVDRLEEKFQREARNIFSLNHPNIVGVSDILRENGTSYYVMDFISGSSLQTIIDREGPLPEARALKYIGQVMDALEYVHSRSMLHLDIKPDNIMIDAEADKTILIDFGVSKQYDEVDGHNTSTIMGQTPGFAPLEQIGNNIKHFTPATDIYALGATLYCVLSGQAPPACSDMMSGVAQLAPLPASVSPSTRKAIAEMMQPNLRLRPQSIAVVRQMLNQSVGEPMMPLDFEPEADEPQKSKKWIWAIVAGVATLVVAGAAALCLRGCHGAPADQVVSEDSTIVEEAVDYEGVDSADFEDYKVEPVVIVETEDKQQSDLTEEEKTSIEQTSLEEMKQSSATQVVIVEEQNPTESERVYDAAEQQPSFPGGEAAMYNFLSNNVRYPADATEAGVQGRVIVQFIVEKDGSITGVRVLRSPNDSLSAEAIRVVKSMPKWNPGRINGQPVRVTFTLPITFKLSN